MNDLIDEKNLAYAATQGGELGPGSIIGGCYILFQCVGHSGRSSVWTCRHKDLDGALLAIRILNPRLITDKTACARFHREVVASYTVNHPNVVRTHEFINDGQHIAYTMEFMEYGTLKALLDTGEPLSIADILLIASQIAAGLEGIHQTGLIHRNLKPSNVFFSAEGDIKIADFGIAKSESGPKLTNDGEVLGSVGYTSPEYLSTGEVDARGDVYALGLLLYEMITGNYPFYSPNPVEAIRLRMTSDPLSPSEARLDCPLELSAIVMKAMARNPDERYQTAEHIQGELEALAETASTDVNRYEARKRSQSFWNHIPEPYLNLGVGHEGTNEKAIEKLRTTVSNDLTRRRMIFSVILASLFGILGILLALTVAHSTSAKHALANLELKLDSAKSALFSPSHPTKKGVATSENSQTLPSTTYVVEPGDTLSGISVRFNISTRALMEANGISDPRKLRVGTPLTIPN